MNSKARSPLIITGMHRSGTSLFASILESAGIDIGKSLVEATANDNPHGYFEDQLFVDFHDSVLNRYSVGFIDPESFQIGWDDLDVARAENLVSRREKETSGNVWGWKDPRTVLFLNEWRAKCPDAFFFFLYRYPTDVMLSLFRRRGGFNRHPANALLLWKLHNERILSFIDTELSPSDYLLVNIEGLVSDPDKFEQLATRQDLLRERSKFSEVFNAQSLTRLKYPRWTEQYFEEFCKGTFSVYRELELRAHLPYGHEKYTQDEELTEPAESALKAIVGGLQDVHYGLLTEYRRASSRSNEAQRFLNIASILREQKGVPKKIIDLGFSAINVAARIRRWNRTRLELKSFQNEGLLDVRDSLAIRLNQEYDTIHSSQADGFEHVLHVFHFGDHWNGVRSAAGYMPGLKLAIAHKPKLDDESLVRVLAIIEEYSVQALVIHSATPFMFELARMLRQKTSKSLNLLFCWHASTAQFNQPELLGEFCTILNMVEERTISGVGVVKHGMQEISDKIHSETLLNFPPFLDSSKPQEPPRENNLVIPLPNHLRKNLYTNFIAAIGLEDIDQIFVSSIEGLDAFSTRKKLSVLGKSRGVPRDKIHACMKRSRLVLSCTLSECQPMVFLEGLALEVPVLTGPLEIGFLDDHPYRALTEVIKSDSIAAIRKKAEEAIELSIHSHDSLVSMMRSYKEELVNEAEIRLRSFVT